MANRAGHTEEDFVRHGMLPWFTPKELVRLGVHTVLSGLFGSYADKREGMAAVPTGAPPAAPAPAKGSGDVWFDYVADVGDGFDATYSVAYAVAQTPIALPAGEGGPDVVSKAPAILFLGGDQVYPVAGDGEYRDKFRGPYAAALPPVDGNDERADLYAIPGNHDWYDGLTAFTRLFCQERTLGAWRTRQRRSYFAVELGHGWWVWGIDVQLKSSIDGPQLDYFRALASSDRMRPGSKVILVTAEPTWVYLGTQEKDTHRVLSFFESSVIRENGHRLALGLSGDLHCYARYEARDERAALAADPTPWVMAGGGGAALHPPHALPRRTACDVGGRKRTWTLAKLDGVGTEAIYPPARSSKRLRWRAFLLPVFNPGFSTLLGSLYLWFACLLAGSTSADRLDALSTAGPSSTALHVVADVALDAPALLLLVAATLIGLIFLADFPPVRSPDGRPPTGCQRFWKWVVKSIFGAGHTIVHLSLWLLAMWASAWVATNVFRLAGPGWPHLGRVAIEAAGVVFVGGLLGGFALGAYFFVANLFGGHAAEVLVCSSVKDYKQFLRFRLDSAGRLWMYAIGIDRVCRAWNPAEGLGAGDPLIAPVDKSAFAKSVRRIEGPIAIP